MMPEAIDRKATEVDGYNSLPFDATVASARLLPDRQSKTRSYRSLQRHLHRRV